MTLAAFIDGRTASSEREGMERHLARCPDCLAMVLDLKVRMGARMVRVPLWQSVAKGLVAASLLLAVAVPGFAMGRGTFLLGRQAEQAIAAEISFGLVESVR